MPSLDKVQFGGITKPLDLINLNFKRYVRFIGPTNTSRKYG